MEKMRYIKYNVSVCQVCISRQMPKDSRVTCQLSVIVIFNKMSVFVNSMLISANTARQHAEGLSVICVGSKYFVGEFKMLAKNNHYSMLILANAARQHAEGLHIGGKHFVGEYNKLAYKSNAKNTRCQKIHEAQKIQLKWKK